MSKCGKWGKKTFAEVARCDCRAGPFNMHRENRGFFQKEVVKECGEVEKQAQFLEKELNVEDYNEVWGNQVN